MLLTETCFLSMVICTCTCVLKCFRCLQQSPFNMRMRDRYTSWSGRINRNISWNVVFTENKTFHLQSQKMSSWMILFFTCPVGGAVWNIPFQLWSKLRPVGRRGWSAFYPSSISSHVSGRGNLRSPDPCQLEQAARPWGIRRIIYSDSRADFRDSLLMNLKPANFQTKCKYYLTAGA